MTTLTNSFETGLSSGTTLTAANSGNGSAGTPVDLVTTGGGNTIVYDDAHPAHGGLGARINVTASSGNPAFLEWSTALLPAGNTNALVYTRIGIWYTDPPANGDFAVLRGLAVGNQRWRVAINTAGKITVHGSGSAVATSTLTLSPSTHYRVECAAAASATQANCTIEVRIYAGDSTTPLETITQTNVAMGGPIDRVRFGIGASSTSSAARALWIDDIGASTVTWLGPAVPTATVYHAWVGAVTSSAATVAYGLGNVSSARLVVSTSEDLSLPVYSSSGTVDGQGCVKLTRTGLTADTLYYFGIEADGAVLDDGRGSFTTDPAPGSPASFSVAFGSCQQTNSNSITFTKIAEREGPYGRARRVLHEGDLHYRDFGTGTTSSDVRAQFRSSLSTPAMQQMLTSIPTVYGWDNHDWGGPNSDASAPAGPATAAAYRQFVPHYPLPTSGDTGIWQSFVLGRVRFIVLDTRSQRSPRTDAESSSKTLLGSEQKAWFFDQLLEPEPVKIIVCGIYWRHDSANGDRWGSYGTEFQEIRSWILARPQVRAYVIFGDRHALCADDGSSPGCYLPQSGGAPFDQGSSAAFEPWSHGYYEGVANTNLKAFGWLDITDDGAGITVSYSGITSNDDVTRVSMETVFPAAAALPARWGIHMR